ncbi:uncharacterized protein LOC143604938 [Bidens hawaiensis]|uniref:uncharacterized protein LOC143604938 n=1 Tax=Bidens hawaiensis TaxID=980011 RepID=UPI00404A6BC9
MAAPHPALTISNIKNFIPITLELENGQYNSWVELFTIHCTVFQVLDHIIPPTTQPSKPATEANKGKAPESLVSWERLDAIIKQWLYSTISNDLLLTVIKRNGTAMETWESIAQLFQDNQAQRALILKNRFLSTKVESFPNVSTYCQELKVLSDQLANLNAPVSDPDLVLQLINGLAHSPYDSIGMIISQTKPLPNFFEARSRLTMEEGRRAGSSSTAATVFYTTVQQPNSQTGCFSSDSSYGTRGHSDSNQRGRGRGGYCGRGRGHSRGRGYNNQNQNQHTYFSPTNQNYNPGNHNTSSPTWDTKSWGNQSGGPTTTQGQHPQWQTTPWQIPPAPHPTVPFSRPNPSPGILGPNPQAHYTQYNNQNPYSYPSSQYPNQTSNQYVPTNLEQALHTMTLNPDLQWNLDTGATNHMTNTTGNLSSYFNNRISNNIIVGNGFQIPILGTEYTKLNTNHKPLHINNVLYAPQLITNLLSVRRLTTDNLISIEFDPFGFLVKDYLTRIPILRSNSTGDLYPLALSTDTKFTSPATFAALSQDLWHRRLGHPGNSLLQCLNKKQFISVDRPSIKRLCQSCVFGKHVKLPFYDSLSTTYMPFDILHSDLWTSPVLSTGVIATTPYF